MSPRQHAGGSLHAALRNGTRRAHDVLDRLFPHGVTSAADYRAYLAGMHQLCAAVDACFDVVPAAAALTAWRPRAHCALLRDDLADTGTRALPDSIALPLRDASALLGAIYVVQGSALGARVLVKQAVALGWRADRGARFLHAHADDAAQPAWRALLEAIEAVPMGPQEDQLFIGALDTFTFAAHEFRRARLREGLHAI